MVSIGGRWLGNKAPPSHVRVRKGWWWATRPLRLAFERGRGWWCQLKGGGWATKPLCLTFESRVVVGNKPEAPPSCVRAREVVVECGGGQRDPSVSHSSEGGGGGQQDPSVLRKGRWWATRPLYLQLKVSRTKKKGCGCTSYTLELPSLLLPWYVVVDVAGDMT